MSSFSSVLRTAIENAGWDMTKLASALGMSRTTVAAKLNGQNPLDPQRQKDVAFAAQVCDQIGADLNSVLEQVQRRDEQNRSASGADPALADVLLDVLEDDRASPERKQVVRETIKRWIANAAM